LPVGLDLEMQADGSFLASRVEVDDANVADLTISGGPLEHVASSVPTYLTYLGREQQGQLDPGLFGASAFGNAAFQISGQLANLGSLPFQVSFSAADMVPGQNVLLTLHAATLGGGAANTPLATVTLIPQTIDGTVSAVSNSGGFTVYAVALAAYDLFPALAVQQGQTTLLTNPGAVMVYVGSGTQLLSSGAIGVGSVLRFNGLVFNDSGTLRMDCAQVNDGVPE